ncbi:response regulator receiver modulated diguanylate cyclase [Gemmobacter aquatilis]|uniref:diguanylate cyclase n=1 Tax=Gemmobacter aquatilis TaxID=933059 RepID=A0A1H8HVW5_9RHOB|nr:diguanylate cyclase [Gemmobacter aquatilis]SEN60333.1 response regulator receiver modulated diguanylate cyclase [Gemmobacter aquatilis]
MVGKILIVDDVATNRIVLKVKLGEACYQALLAADGKSCLALAAEERPDLILLDLSLTGRLQGLTALDTLTALRASPRTADIPVLALGSADQSGLGLAALRGGADDVMTKPLPDALLMARIRNLLRSRETRAELGERGATLREIGLAEAAAPFVTPGTVALVADRPEVALRWRSQLCPSLQDQLVPLSRSEALAETRSGPGPDVFLIDSGLGGPGGGLRLMSELRSHPATRHAAILLLQTAPSPQEQAMAYDMGANDVQPADVDPQALGLRLTRLMAHKREADQLRNAVHDGLRLAVIDPLTGLYNRRYALPRLSAIAERTYAGAGSFAVMVIDLDLFKNVNDRWGHAAGDAVLVEIAHRLTDNLRGSDLVARLGGEEFLVALPDVSLIEARATAERLCRMVQGKPVLLPDGTKVRVTVSIGLTVGHQSDMGHFDAVASLVDRADQALLAAKAGGRNQVILSRNAA